ncbi:MAG: sulfite exporter TauE/SafE family protein, partial [Pseudomonadota bacterium]
MLADPLFLGTAVLAILIAGLSKGGFGSAAAFASTPILALVVPATTAAAILLPILMVIDLTSLYAYRKVLNWRSALPMMMASVVGIGLGWWFFGAVDEAWIRLALGVFALVFVLYFIFRPKAPTAGKSRLWLLAGGGFWGSIAGFTSFVAHAGGPPVAMHLLPQNLSK